MMSGIQMLCNDPSMWQFTICVLRVANRESRDRATSYTRCECGYRTGVQPPTQKHPKGNVTHQVTTDGALQQSAVSTNVLGFPNLLLIGPNPQIPVALNPYLAVFIDFEPVPREQLVYPLVKGIGSGDVAESEIFWQRTPMECSRHSGVGEYNFYIRAKNECLRGKVVVKRFYSQPVSRHKQFPSPSVPDRESKHATQVMQTLSAIFFIKVDDGFRVAVRLEMVALGD